MTMVGFVVALLLIAPLTAHVTRALPPNALSQPPVKPAQPLRWRGLRIDLPVADGTRIHSDTLVGRLVLLNLWASWCVPCRAELPALDSLRRRWADSGVTVLLVNEDANRARAQLFLDQAGLQPPLILGGVFQHERYGIRGLPATLLLNHEGREIRRWIGYHGVEQLDDIATAVRSARAVPPLP